MRTAINLSLRKGKMGEHWESLVGYMVEDLKQHIESQFKNGMTWEKFMAGEIHIDHKIPISLFCYEAAEDREFKQCWALVNLRPMWKSENLSKKDKVLKEDA